jgi:flagellar motor switch protein FliM
MERILSQDQIDAIVRNARGSQSAEDIDARRLITPCTFRESRQLVGDKVRAVSELLDTFVRNLTLSLGAQLSVPFEAKLASVEQLSYGEYLERIPPITFMMSLRVLPLTALAVMQIDNALVFPMIDILLGGTGQNQDMAREVTEIEEMIMEEVVGLVCRDLGVVVGQLGIKFEPEKRQKASQIQRFWAPTEKTLCINLEIRLLEVRASLNLVLPAAVSNPLMRRLAHTKAADESPIQAAEHLTERMLHCSFPAALELTAIDLTIRELISLAPGHLLDLRVPAGEPASLQVAGRKLFEAAPVRSGSCRAAHIGEPVTTLEPTGA